MKASSLIQAQPSLNIALLVISNPGFELMMTAGEFKPPTLSLTGVKAAASFERAFVDKLFLATGGIANTLDRTYPSFNDITVRKAMIHSGRVTFLLVGSIKFGKTGNASLGSLSQIDYLITDAGIPDTFRHRITDLTVNVIIA